MAVTMAVGVVVVIQNKDSCELRGGSGAAGDEKALILIEIL